MRNALQAELKQNKPFKSLQEEAVLSITRTAAVLEHGVAQALRPHEITFTQYNVLRILRGAGAQGLCRLEVGERLVRRVPDVTRLLDRMEDNGLIARRRGKDDRRYVATHITPKGLDLVAAIDREICEIHNRQIGHVDARSLRLLIEVLTKVRARG
jgi:DNA-binding MarR family transcriptional regulator